MWNCGCDVSVCVGGIHHYRIHSNIPAMLCLYWIIIWSGVPKTLSSFVMSTIKLHRLYNNLDPKITISPKMKGFSYFIKQWSKLARFQDNGYNACNFAQKLRHCGNEALRCDFWFITILHIFYLSSISPL